MATTIRQASEQQHSPQPTMPRVNTTALQIGMKVVDDVRNADGMLLLPSGCELTERHLTILESWGISEINVTIPDGMDDPSDPLARLDASTLAQLTEETRGRFWQLDESHPAAREIFQAMLRRLARRHSTRPHA